MVHYTYAIIGGGIAGVTCAEHLEILDGESEVALISGSDLIKSVTNVLHLSKCIDVFDVEEKNHAYLSELCPSVTVKTSAADCVDTDRKVITLRNGEAISYSKLCLCTGALPKKSLPPNPNVLYIRDTETVKVLSARLKGAKRIIILGNGGIATEMVYEIAGVDVIWAIKDPYMNTAFIDPGASEFLKSQLSNNTVNSSPVTKRSKYVAEGGQTHDSEMVGSALGPDWLGTLNLVSSENRKVSIEKSVEVKKLHDFNDIKSNNLTVEDNPTNVNQDHQWPLYVEFTNGKIYGCDFLVSATGVTPNTQLIDGIALAADGGVSVGEDMMSSVVDVYAAGDACTPTWEWPLHWVQMRLWTQARQMGSYAAKCMWASLTDTRIYRDFCFELYTHATKFFGFKVVLLGLFNGQKLEGQYEILLRMTKGLEYIKVIMKDGKMQGAILIGDTDLEETFENLILNQMDLSSYGEHLLDPDVDIEDYFD